MAWFSEFKFLLAIKLNFDGGQFLVISKRWKNQNTVGKNLTFEIELWSLSGNFWAIAFKY